MFGQVNSVCLLVLGQVPNFNMVMKKATTIKVAFIRYWILYPYTHFCSILFYPITLKGRRGTTDEFATIPFHLDLFSAALVELAKSIPVHSLILSSHLFFCLPLFLFPFTVPWRIVFAKPEDLETWPNHLSFCFLTRTIYTLKLWNLSLPVRMYMKCCCTTLGINIGSCGISRLLKLYVKIFYVMGRVLTGELSCMRTGLVSQQL